MGPELISIIVLAIMFVIATWRDVNMGLLGFIAAVGVGSLVLGQKINESLAGFPVDLFLILVGLTYLFGFAQNNGSIEVIVNWCVRLVRGRMELLPWAFFGLTAVMMGFGALAVVGIVTPLALTVARRHGINQFMMGLMVAHGAVAGAFSPISVYGIFINGYLDSAGFPPAPLTLFLMPLAFNTIFAAIIYALLRNRPGLRVEGDAGSDLTGVPGSGPGTRIQAGGTIVDVKTRVTGTQVLTLLGLGAMVLSVLVFGLNLGVVTLVISVILAIIDPAAGKAALSKVSWPIVVLVTGVLTYIVVLQSAGAVEWVSGGISAVGIPLLAALLLFYMAGLISALASSLAIIGVVMALALPFLQSGDVHVGGFIAALAISATIVDISPFSSNGAMLLANVEASIRDRYYKQLLAYAGFLCLVGPGLAWFVAAIPTWIGA
ncbi:hypothetical protein AU252_01570 [Pseudarthrobacter sulfonivorans]|uniref:Dicarboxylate carrier MatC N-terminal domain-containing protein n=2 Tax=Pseudarthrobacter sulfonivorans TaxID=121292 RepID=A0A0U3P3V1_9MICC|nr:SLC13 family permease [Pseudarthrobacter sulfonivorans]ALV40016.1 hypothetical protein AU252_01570 [Pseudarthrobacter sulfonivorans]